MFRNIIWDFDGTLFNTYPCMTTALKKALSEQKVEASEEDILKKLKISLGEAIVYYEKLHNIDSTKLKERFRHHENSVNFDLILPFPHVKEVLEHVIKLKGRNFIYTHRDNLTIKLLEYYDMLKYFTEVVTIEKGLKRKPDAEGFIYIIEGNEIDKSRALAVGDRELDLMAAVNSGIKSCLFGDNGENFSYKPDFIIQSMDELYKIITE